MDPTDIAFKVISAIGAVTGSWALIRSYWLTRSKLVLVQKLGDWSSYHGALLQFTVLVSNKSTQANSIVLWEGSLRSKQGTMKKIELEQGDFSLRGSNNAEPIIERSFNVTPFNIPALSTVECYVTALRVAESDWAQPWELGVTAPDMHRKRYECTCRFPLPPRP